MARFVGDARRIARRATEVAGEVGARSVEAEHILLAVAGGPEGAVRARLAEARLDRDGILRALAAEEAHSLAAAGVARDGFDVPPRPAAHPPGRWGASAKLALERAVRIAATRRERSVTAGHVVLGVLAATRGTVPRALAATGVDRAHLAARVEEAMALH